MENLEGRLGERVLRKRLEREQADFKLQTDHPVMIMLDRVVSNYALMSLFFRMSGLLSRGQRNAIDVRVYENTFNLPTIPDAFDGYRLLQLSDLHFGCSPGLNEGILNAVKQVSCDATVITGDFCFIVQEPVDAAMREMEALLPELPQPVLAVLGNHDRLEVAECLEEMGITVLLNEAFQLEREGEQLWIAGVDDPYHFETDDAYRAQEPIPDGATSVLLSHSPENYEEAAMLGYDIMLSGHTHGGQVCLPGEIPVFNHARAPRSVNRGAWRCAGLQGYTSRGTGATSVDVRLNCPAEITVHRLQKG